MSCALIAVATTLMMNPIAAQKPKLEVMVLGTYHMANPKLDYIKTELDDHLAPKRQKEIEEVAAAIARFKPDKIALESPWGSTKILENYAGYLAGSYNLVANETDQLGFRIAKGLGHKAVFPIDFRSGMDIDGVMKYAAEKEPAVAAEFGQIVQRVQKMLEGRSKMTVREILIEDNNPDFLRQSHGLYLKMARVGAGDNYIGSDVVSGWFNRNLRIYVNLTKIVEPGDKRILVLFGAGHAPILRQMIQDSEDMALVDPLRFLKK